MLFRPSYCAHCGEKIERAEWHIWTSRRFCELCATEFRGIDLLPKLAAATGLLGIALAVSGYVDRGPAVSKPVAAKQTADLVSRPAAVSGNPAPPAAVETKPAFRQPAQMPVAPQQQSAASQGPAAGRAKSEEGVYICGAPTKKGTPCSRRVKGNVRCFQHTGMPAMLPPDKLRVG